MFYVCCMQCMQHIFDKRAMRLQLKSSNDETCTQTLLELITFAIKNVTKHQLLKLLNNYYYHEEFQSNCKNDDENEAFEAI